MDIYVFNKSFQLQGVIDTYTSLIWRREYQKIGHAELHMHVNEYFPLLQKGNLLVKENDLTEAIEIDTVEISDSDSEIVVVKGSSISRYLEDRFVWGTQEASGSIEQVMKYFVNQNAVSPTNVNRRIPNLYLSPNKGYATTANEVNSWSQLSKLMEELAIKYDVGWTIRFDYENKRYLFDVYRGIDSSSEQSENPMVIFSNDYENVYDQAYIDTDKSLKTMVLVAGQGEGSDRRLVTVNNDLTGFDRKELFIDARDISDKDQDGNAINTAVYISRLTERGSTKLAEHKSIVTFESGISVTSNYKYREDFDLGDMVTIQNNKWGTTLNTRIVAIEEVYEDNNIDVRVDFGSNLPTLADKLDKEEKSPIFTGTGYYKSNEIDLKLSDVNSSLSTIGNRNYVKVADTRDVLPIPDELEDRTVYFDFKRRTTIGSPNNGANNVYAHVMTFNGWQGDNNTGGYPTQLSIGPNGLSVRQAVSPTTWGSWRDIPTADSETWWSVTLKNSWVHYTGYGTPGYYKDPMGIVRLRGLVRNGTVGNNSTGVIFTLPEGYRPATRAIFTNNTNTGAGRLDVNTNGEVIAVAGGTGHFSLDGVSFRAEK